MASGHFVCGVCHVWVLPLQLQFIRLKTFWVESFTSRYLQGCNLTFFTLETMSPEDLAKFCAKDLSKLCQILNYNLACCMKKLPMSHKHLAKQ